MLDNLSIRANAEADAPAALPAAATAASRQSRERSILACAMDCLGMAVLVVDGKGRPVAASAAAHACGAVAAAMREHAPALVRRARGQQRKVGVPVEAADGARYWLVASTIPASWDALVVIQAIDASGPDRLDPGLVADLCGLTRSEAEVACMVAGGMVPKAIARRLDVSVATVKTHLHRVFRKTGARGQADIARRVSRLPAAAPQA
ncbi:MAG: helix-turn-helix transcriptional regulator [Alphaproteobacteria bacterium]|nr:helix-turn-helix transcriptional regulator [Alphaproteobacteria bacterium]